MDIVVDTNVFVGACLGAGACRAVIASCLEGAHVPLMGVALFAEYEDVLGRVALFRASRLTAEQRGELLDAWIATTRWVRLYFGWRPNLPDEADNHLIELAVAGQASCLVTRNARDFRRADLSFPSLTILTPEQFLAQEHRQ